MKHVDEYALEFEMSGKSDGDVLNIFLIPLLSDAAQFGERRGKTKESLFEGFYLAEKTWRALAVKFRNLKPNGFRDFVKIRQMLDSTSYAEWARYCVEKSSTQGRTYARSARGEDNLRRN